MQFIVCNICIVAGALRKNIGPHVFVCSDKQEGLCFALFAYDLLILHDALLHIFKHVFVSLIIPQSSDSSLSAHHISISET